MTTARVTAATGSPAIFGFETLKTGGFASPPFDGFANSMCAFNAQSDLDSIVCHMRHERETFLAVQAHGATANCFSPTGA